MASARNTINAAVCEKAWTQNSSAGLNNGRPLENVSTDDIPEAMIAGRWSRLEDTGLMSVEYCY